MTFPNTIHLLSKNAASALVSAASCAGLDVSGLDPMSQLQSVCANLLVDSPCLILYAASATTANTAASATFATSAGNADTATFATSAGSASTATTAGSAATATFATTAGSASTATTATTATMLATSRTINGVLFDGSADITVAVVSAPKLTTPRNINGIAFDGSADITVAVASVAKLTTARNINGVAFDGSADITVTAAAGTLTGTTLNSTVTASSLISGGATFTVTSAYKVNGTQVLGAQQADIANVSTGGLVLLGDVITALGTVQSKINAMLAMFRVHGFMA